MCCFFAPKPTEKDAFFSPLLFCAAIDLFFAGYQLLIVK